MDLRNTGDAAYIRAKASKHSHSASNQTNSHGSVQSENGGDMVESLLSSILKFQDIDKANLMQLKEIEKALLEDDRQKALAIVHSASAAY